ncbi:MAG: PHP domain-containing protein [Candidatus Cloacimonetes bacterium]|nr:PHP domain-containing protein [Candidatus Cloacimonadota bacterium]
MHWFKADLHIHSVLSPCGALSMSPQMVISKACERELDIIAITDHNSMANCSAYKEVADKAGIHLLYGMEVQTAEEIHLITLFDAPAAAAAFSEIIYESLLPVANDPDFFGDQVVVDADANIVRIEEKALINSSLLSLEEVLEKAVEYGALIFPAHVDAGSFSIIGQLGMIPSGLPIDACGITAKADHNRLMVQYPQLADYTLIRNSDAHYPEDIGAGYTEFYLDQPTIAELKMACRQECGRKVFLKDL